jgi:hypothetical protein
MDGSNAQLVSLVCHANAHLRRGWLPVGYFADNSAFEFCDRVSFVESRKSWLGASREDLVAENPASWFQYLKNEKALGLRLYWQPDQIPYLPDRITAGFVGGGGRWILAAMHPGGANYWISRWEAWNEDAPEDRSWRVNYVLVARGQELPPDSRPILDVKTDLESALERIIEFAENHDCTGFRDRFLQALYILQTGTGEPLNHRNLYPPDSISSESASLLAAVERAWVFGGMGSWNDIGFDGDDQREYDETSDQLYTALVHALCAATNESAKKFLTWNAN